MQRGVAHLRQALFDLEGDVYKQAGFPVNSGDLCCRRAEDIALPSFLAALNSVGELVESGNYSF